MLDFRHIIALFDHVCLKNKKKWHEAVVNKQRTHSFQTKNENQKSQVVYTVTNILGIIILDIKRSF